MSYLANTFRAMWSTPGPTAAIEIARDQISGVSLTSGKSHPRVAGHASEPLPAGALAPSVTTTNVIDRPTVTRALQSVLTRLPRRPRRIGLVVPDSVAKVSLVRFDSVPARRADLERLIRWQVRKAAPFKLEEAQVAFTPGASLPEGGREFIVALMRLAIVEEYEAVCLAAGVQPGVVDLVSFSLINAALVGTSTPTNQDWLLVHAAAGYNTIAIIRGHDVIFFRNRLIEHEGDLADLVHQTAMYYEDRLDGAGLSRTLLAAAAHTKPQTTEQLVRVIGGRLGTEVEMMTTHAVSSRDADAGDSGVLRSLAGPLGLLLREREAA